MNKERTGLHDVAFAQFAARSRQAARVVIAEDDEDMRSLVAAALRRDGHHVTELANGAELLVRIAHQYREHEPADSIDLVVSDIRMPVISGLEILRGLRDAHCQTPVVLMTAFGDPSTRREAEALDAVVIDKPLQLSELRERVRFLLDARGIGSM